VKRKTPCDHKIPDTQEVKKMKAPLNNRNISPALNKNVENTATDSQMSAFSGCGSIGFLQSEIDGVRLPSKWEVRKDDKDPMLRYYYQVLAENKKVILQKVAVVNFSSKKITYSVLSNGLSNVPKQLKSFTNMKQLANILMVLDATGICPGII
jgi:hypothetical protein